MRYFVLFIGLIISATGFANEAEAIIESSAWWQHPALLIVFLYALLAYQIHKKLF